MSGCLSFCLCMYLSLYNMCILNTFKNDLRFYNVLLSEKAIVPHSSTLAWKIPWTEEPGGLQSMGSQRVGHDWVTSLWLFTFMHWRRKWQPTPVFLPRESQGRGSLVGCRLWGRKSQTRLKRLSSSSSLMTTSWVLFIPHFTFQGLPISCYSTELCYGKLLW